MCIFYPDLLSVLKTEKTWVWNKTGARKTLDICFTSSLIHAQVHSHGHRPHSRPTRASFHSWRQLLRHAEDPAAEPSLVPDQSSQKGQESRLPQRDVWISSHVRETSRSKFEDDVMLFRSIFPAWAYWRTDSTSGWPRGPRAQPLKGDNVIAWHSCSSKGKICWFCHWEKWAWGKQPFPEHPQPPFAREIGARPTRLISLHTLDIWPLCFSKPLLWSGVVACLCLFLVSMVPLNFGEHLWDNVVMLFPSLARARLHPNLFFIIL